ncbi:MAG TPA: hypothetical protein VGS06_42595, partial [Streptosporangiaceae bacterium]|nr:hypothetical protein [Streptosporangiaceae bacterium]
RPTTSYQPDIAALQATPARIVVGAGTTSKGQLANRTAMALAAQLGTPVVKFPGDHGGFLALPEQFGRLLDQVFSQRPERDSRAPPGSPPSAVVPAPGRLTVLPGAVTGHRRQGGTP